MPSAVDAAAVRSQVRAAIAHGDQVGALRMLRALVSAAPEAAAELTATTAEALIAVAADGPAAEQSAAVTAYHDVEAAFRSIAERIQSTALEREHIHRLRALLDARERELDAQADQRCYEELAHAAASPQRRFGNGWLEIKWIPRPNGTSTGPYLYYRVREGGRLRSRYIGKTTAR
jgi:hypothetical protein